MNSTPVQCSSRFRQYFDWVSSCWIKMNESPSALNHRGLWLVPARSRWACSMRAFSFSAWSTCPASSNLKSNGDESKLVFAFVVTVDPVENAYRSEEDVDEVRRLTRSIRLQNEWNRSIVWNFLARHLRRERETIDRTTASFLPLTLTPNTFRRLIVAAENVLVPMAEDFVHDAARRIFNITSDIVQSRSIITLNETKRESIGEPHDDSTWMKLMRAWGPNELCTSTSP